MKFNLIICHSVSVFVFSILLTHSAQAHDVFKKEMDKKFPNMKVTCNACHVDKKPKTERTAFGKLFQKEMAAEELTKNLKTKKGTEKTDYQQKVMIPAFEKAFAKVSAMTYEEIINAGMVDGISESSGAKEE